MAIIQPSISELPSVYLPRAWTYQEKRLSHCLVYLTDSQVCFSDSDSRFLEDRYSDDPTCKIRWCGVLIGQM